jgi:hypothetical protein
VRTSVVFVIWVGTLVALAAYGVAAQHRVPQWTHEWCATNACIGKVLNSLPPDRAAEAKLTTWRDSTYVWYRQ